MLILCMLVGENGWACDCELNGRQSKLHLYAASIWPASTLVGFDLWLVLRLPYPLLSSQWQQEQKASGAPLLATASLSPSSASKPTRIRRGWHAQHLSGLTCFNRLQHDYVMIATLLARLVKLSRAEGRLSKAPGKHHGVKTEAPRLPAYPKRGQALPQHKDG